MRLLFSLFCLLAGLSISPALEIKDVNAEDTKKQKDECATRMKKIGEALNAAKAKNGNYPDKLEDLVPDFLPDKAALEPLENRHYIYEYAASSPKVRDNMLIRKKAQILVFGDAVPLLRCSLEEDKTLILPINGEVYEASRSWETSTAVLDILKKRGGEITDPKWPKLKLVVKDDKNAPLEGVKVTALKRVSGSVTLPDWVYTTDAEGGTTINLGPSNTSSLLLFFDKPGLSINPMDLPLNTRPAKVVAIMKPAETVSGLCLDPDGKPISKAEVEILVPQINKDGDLTEIKLVSVKTGEDGRWTCTSMPSGTKEFALRTSHDAFWTSVYFAEPAPPNAEDASSIKRATFADGTAVLKLKPATVFSGVIRDPEGKPISGAELSASVRTTRYEKNTTYTSTRSLNTVKTAADGRYELPMNKEGRVTLKVSSTGHVIKMVSFEAEAAAKGPGDLTLEPGEELRILLLDRESKPLADVSITGWISGPEGDSSQSLTLGKTDKDGFVVWKQAPPRTTELQIQFYASKDKSSASQQWDKQSRNKEKNADVILQMGKQR